MSDDTPLPPAFPDGRPAEAQPKWRRDFPIDIPEDEYISRRDFTKFLMLTSGAFVAGQLSLLRQSHRRRTKLPPKALAIARLDDIAVGQVIPFRYPAEHEPCLLVRIRPDHLVAFGQKCSHLSCPVEPDVQGGQFICPCHKGSFDLETGLPTGGPPRRPLPRIHLEVHDGVVYAMDVELRT